MSLVTGARVGPYEIVAPIGAGGMGEVYRARDAKLGRDVAIKILPPAFAGDSDRRARFEREARTLASLNHPHIAQIYGFEEMPSTSEGASGAGALIMELVDGPTLAERLAQSGRVPIDEAVAIARQIADALEAAHEQGIIHRDLKPANIKIRHDGTVKVLDFGLAKALEPLGAGGSDDISAMNSPTQTARATVAGIVLGTAAYMAPEQARGEACGSAGRHLGVRYGALRNAHRQTRLQGRRHAGHSRVGVETGPRLERAPGKRASVYSTAASAKPGEESARPAERHRRRASGTRRARGGGCRAAEVDRARHSASCGARSPSRRRSPSSR